MEVAVMTLIEKTLKRVIRWVRDVRSKLDGSETTGVYPRNPEDGDVTVTGNEFAAGLHNHPGA